MKVRVIRSMLQHLFCSVVHCFLIWFCLVTLTTDCTCRQLDHTFIATSFLDSYTSVTTLTLSPMIYYRAVHIPCTIIIAIVTDYISAIPVNHSYAAGKKPFSSIHPC